jgi:plasmid stability protein
MPTLTIPDIDDATYARLEADAKRHGRTVVEEARATLADPKIHAAWEALNRLRGEVAASGRPQSDGVQLLREDRDR